MLERHMQMTHTRYYLNCTIPSKGQSAVRTEDLIFVLAIPKTDFKDIPRIYKYMIKENNIVCV